MMEAICLHTDDGGGSCSWEELVEEGTLDSKLPNILLIITALYTHKNYYLVCGYKILCFYCLIILYRWEQLFTSYISYSLTGPF
jgi:hypothetical protein